MNCAWTWFYLSPFVCEMWNSWMTIFSIFRDFEWQTCQCQRDFTWNCWNYVNLTWKEIQAKELKWNVILWNGENCLWAWIFRKHEFTFTENSRSKAFFSISRIRVSLQFYVMIFRSCLIHVISAISREIPLNLTSFSHKIIMNEKIVILRFQLSRKNWHVSRDSCLIHRNSGYDRLMTSIYI